MLRISTSALFISGPDGELCGQLQTSHCSGGRVHHRDFALVATDRPSFIHTCRNPSVLGAGEAHQWPACEPHSSGSLVGTESAEMALWRDVCQRQTGLGEATLELGSSSGSPFAIHLGLPSALRLRLPGRTACIADISPLSEDLNQTR